MDLSWIGAVRFWQRNLRIFRKIFLGALPNNFVEPALYLLALGLGLGAFVREIDGMPYIQYVATGIVASAVMFGATFECTYNAFVQFHYERSYDAILTTPLSAEDIGVGEILWGATRATMYGTAFLIVVALFGVLRSPWALALPAAFFLGGLLFAILALAFTAVNPSVDYFTYYFSMFVQPMFLFSGIFFPLSGMPEWVRQAAWFTPLYHLVGVSRSFALGTPGTAVGHLTWLICATVLLFPVPVILLKRRLVR
jgi:lipooligosaccharide transport system permease protein